MPPCKRRRGRRKGRLFYSLAGSHLSSDRLVPSREFALHYTGRRSGRQVLPPSFPSTTLEIYYADSRGAAVGRGEAIPKKGQCGGLRKFKTLFTLRSERLFATLDLLPPLPVSTHRMYAQDSHSLFGYLFIRT